MSAKRIFSAVALLSLGLGFGFVTEACDSSGGGSDEDGGSKLTPEAVAKDYCEALCPCFGSDGEDEGDGSDGVAISGGGSACEEDFVSDCENTIEDVFELGDACLDDAYLAYLACLAEEGSCSYCESSPCLEDSGCSDDFLDDYGKCDSGAGGGGGGGPIPVGVVASTSSPASGTPASSGASPSTTSGGEGGSGPVGCEFTNDGECDEPDLCPPGTDTADCEIPPTPCGAECFEDPGCDESPPDPGSACISCVQDEGDSLSECATEAAFGDGCQGNTSCQDFVDCELNGGASCSSEFSLGYEIFVAEILLYCGSCGGGAGF